MNAEREIVKRLFENKEYEASCNNKELEEASFESGGSMYKCAFGKYYKDGEQISRDDYFKAKDGGSAGGKSFNINDIIPKDIHSYTFRDMVNSMDPEDAEYLQDEFAAVGSVFGGTDGVNYMDDASSHQDHETISKVAKTLQSSGIEPKRFGRLTVYSSEDFTVAFSNNDGMISMYYR